MLTLFARCPRAPWTRCRRCGSWGAARAGQENLDVKAATERGIVMHNVMGRNAHAVSDFAVGMLFAEARNIARSHNALMNESWQKKFSNSDFTPEITGKTLGLVGFGYIGRLVAEKLSGFKLKLLVYDPFVSDEALREHNATKASTRGPFPAVRLRLPPRPPDGRHQGAGRQEGPGPDEATAILVTTPGRPGRRGRPLTKR